MYERCIGIKVRGKQIEQPEREFVYRGIAARQFQRSFVLAEGIEVVGAQLDNGLLHIDLVRPTPEPKVRKVEIRPAKPAQSMETRSVDPRIAAGGANTKGS